jgi:hypothetical protein
MKQAGGKRHDADFPALDVEYLGTLRRCRRLLRAGRCGRYQEQRTYQHWEESPYGYDHNFYTKLP